MQRVTVSFRTERQKFDAEVEKRITKLVFATHGQVQLNTPVDTGRLRSSIVVEKSDDGEWIIGTNVPYAIPIELGMEPTIIRPVNKKALKFQIGDRTIFAKSVNHPGFPGRHMFLDAVSWAEANGQQFFR